ncbi:GDSL esterase/lipase APG-like [Forsythia ovata]|uniref:GDSL esterase/lipase APG-like n=1 Tax=Forsythia ovata TaxID=205694 RepID=A0ABD1T8F6_9LAMI
MRSWLTSKQNLYGLGARRIGVTSLPPVGCLPATRTLFGFHESGCVSRINTDAQGFNKKINSAATQLQKQLPDLKIAIFDIFKPLYDLVQNPSNHGMKQINHFKKFIPDELDNLTTITFSFNFASTGFTEATIIP